ncbi:MAG: type IX secretion system membrane protein PorP/SprF [Bacteroidetes bacterium]|nr:type IX secretion system membrane protein PorP/SprF [Bacteroidota bacterium]
MKKSAILPLSIMMLFFVSALHSQQEAQYSMYMFNPLSVNSAYAGTRDAFSAVLLYRNQWTGFKGAPQTTNLSLHAPIRYSNLSLGLSVVDDRLGTTQTTGIKGDIAYKIRLNRKKHYLSFGLKTGVDLFSASQTKALINDNTDATYSNVINRPLFNVGAGIYYYGKRHYLGLSTPKLVENVYDNTGNTRRFKQVQHYYLMGGIVIPVNSVVQFKPSFVVKAVENAPLSADINASFLFYDRLWVGGMYRLKESCGLNVVFYINEYLTLGYAYDYTLTKLRNYNTGSHEIMIGFDMNRRQRSFKTPRYF